MVKLIGRLYVISGEKLTHRWDANAYLVAGDEPTLIDCGSTEGYPALKRNLKLLGYEPKDICRVIATHGHWDHMSGMAQLREESDAQLYLHEADREPVESGDTEATAAFLYGQPAPRVSVDGLLVDAEVLHICGYSFRVFHTPGHTPGCISLLTEINDLNILIAGDTLWGGYHPKIRSNLDDWAASLDRLMTLDVDVMTIGHCPPTLMFDAKIKLQEARQQFGVYFNPWFQPFHVNFRYSNR